MFFKWFSPPYQCCFCKRDRGYLHTVERYGIYGEWDQRIVYHPDCLELVELEPEKFGNKYVDMALFIHELKKESIVQNKKFIKDFKSKVEKLNAKHLERMMPKKSSGDR